jgi:hypothetical protein
MSLGYFKEATYQFSDIYLPGKWSNSWGRVDKQNLTHRRGRFLRGVLVVFDIRDVPRIHQGSYVSMFLESGLTPGGGGNKQNLTHRLFFTECSFIYIDLFLLVFFNVLIIIFRFSLVAKKQSQLSRIEHVNPFLL